MSSCYYTSHQRREVAKPRRVRAINKAEIAAASAFRAAHASPGNSERQTVPELSLSDHPEPVSELERASQWQRDQGLNGACSSSFMIGLKTIERLAEESRASYVCIKSSMSNSTPMLCDISATHDHTPDALDASPCLTLPYWFCSSLAVDGCGDVHFCQIQPGEGVEPKSHLTTELVKR